MIVDIEAKPGTIYKGSASQACNPVYAKDVDVIVPNLVPGTWDVIRTGDEKRLKFKSEVTFESAYQGYSTRKVIVEERNVFCGAYNVMVLSSDNDKTRVIHTDGQKWIAYGGGDRKVKFLDATNGHQTGPVIHGHAGSIKCIALCEKERFVLSGSYDTSIRCWSLDTGKCQKIYRGHQGTINCLVTFSNRACSGSKDKTCRVWDIASGKCEKIFKHRHSISAVRLTDEKCVSGCEAGKIKVWHLYSGSLIKKLSGHHQAITSLQLDNWHIASASRDQYALLWSSQGKFTKCLNALRHPRPVSAISMMFLRIITACEDGKLRIWNGLTGQCQRVIRSNSRSDPIVNMYAIDDRITINTINNVLTLTFEKIEYDYTLKDDKLPSLIKYKKYGDAPVRKHNYAYYRANRMKVAGASDRRILGKTKEDLSEKVYKKSQEQVSHSAKSLSKANLASAKRIQSAITRDSGYCSSPGLRDLIDRSEIRTVSRERSKTATPQQPHDIDSIAKPENPKGPADLSSGMNKRRRRVSWSFDNRTLPRSKKLTLSEMKTLLRSQIRIKGEVPPPDFIYLSVNAIQNKMKPDRALKEIEINEGRRKEELDDYKRHNRPFSSPSRIDPRTKMYVDDMNWRNLLSPNGFHDDEDAVSIESSYVSSISSIREEIEEPRNSTIVREYAPVSIEKKRIASAHSVKTKTSIPKAEHVRPQTSIERRSTSEEKKICSLRSKSVGPTTKKNRITTSAREITQVPMLMYPEALKTSKLAEEVRRRRIEKQKERNDALENDPLKDNVKFELLTHDEVSQQLKDIEKLFEERDKQAELDKEKRQRALWLTRVKQNMNKNNLSKT
ncbi:DgyrCDS11833 [Dimorphilus gyrociliatus]|uniref:DgyrCDS11833 n=1 Tax=Dimorphilus gyrociliatus TaxID=2664684 RepID=A0A7I8W5X5_9ANNE|nr:DgyrCDS11833 [Dimorphilus gyrociliatus]